MENPSYYRALRPPRHWIAKDFCCLRAFVAYVAMYALLPPNSYLAKNSVRQPSRFLDVCLNLITGRNLIFLTSAVCGVRDKCHVCLPMSTNPSFQRMEVLSSGSVPSLEWMPGSDPNGLFSATSDNQKIDQKLHKPVPTSHLKVHFCINVSFNRDVLKLFFHCHNFQKTPAIYLTFSFVFPMFILD